MRGFAPPWSPLLPPREKGPGAGGPKGITMRTLFRVLALVGAALLLLGGLPAGAAPNLAPNPGFEEGEGQRPAHWSASPGGAARAEWATAGHSGGRSIAGSVEDTQSSVWWVSDPIPVTPGGVYALSVWYRCANPSAGWPTPQIQAADGTNLIDWNIPVRTTWGEFRHSFRLGKAHRSVRIALVNYHRAGQQVFWDDVSLMATPEAAGRLEAQEVPVAPTDAAQTAVTPRPYELGNRKPDVPPSLLFGNLAGWRMRISPGMEATAAVSAQQRIWGDRCLRLRYRRSAVGDEIISTSGILVDEQGEGRLDLLPPKPIPIATPFDAAQLWVNGDNYYSVDNPHVSLTFVDAGGKRVAVDLGPVNWMYWFLMYAPVPPGLDPPVALERLSLTRITNTRPLDLYLDALAFIQAPRKPVTLPRWKTPLPFPTRPETILPSVRRPVRNTIRRESDAFVFECATNDGPITYRYEPRTGTLSDIAAVVPGEGTWRPMEGGGPGLAGRGAVGSGGITARLIWIALQNDAVAARWEVNGAGEPVMLTYTLAARGKSLVLSARADHPVVSAFTAGRVAGAHTPRVFWPPHQNYTQLPQPHTLISEKHFASVHFDWYRTESSAFIGAGEVTNGAATLFDRAKYLPKGDGTLNRLGERVVLTISNHFDEVLPNIANPPSPLRDVTRTNLYVTRMHYGGGPADYDSELAFWTRLKSYGVDHLTLRFHADFWRDRESFTLKAQATPAKGGDAVAKRYLTGLRRLGYRFGLYTNYMLISPLSEAWDPDVVALLEDGDRREQGYATNVVKPSRAAELQAAWAPRVHAKFGTSASYCDQHSALSPSDNVEFDPRVPGAGRQRDVFENYGRLLLNERVAHQGPCYSEGAYHMPYAGLADGHYGQTMQPGAPAFPEFTLRKIHPLSADVGYDLSCLNDNVDRLLAMQIVYGHVGMFWGAAYSGHVPQISVPEVLRSYFMMQQLQQRYTMEPVRSIRYYNGGAWVDADAALRSGAAGRGQVMAVYRNGLATVVNAAREGNLDVAAGRRRLVLPPAGWAAWDTRGFLEYSALSGGNRCDFVSSPEYVYLDGRGTQAEAGGIASAGQVIVLRRAGRLRVVPVEPRTPFSLRLTSLGLRPAGTLRLAFTRQSGETLSRSQVRWPANDRLAPTLPKGAFAVEIASP